MGRADLQAEKQTEAEQGGGKQDRTGHGRQDRGAAGQGDHGGGVDERTAEVEPLPAGLGPLALEKEQGHGDGTGTERAHDQKDGAPAEQVGQLAADKGTDRQPHVHRRHVDAQRPAAPFGRKDGGENGHAGGGEQAHPQPLHRPQRDQGKAGGDKGRGQGAQGVDHQAGGEHPLAAVDVGDPAGRDQPHGHGHQVGGGHPAQLDGIQGKVRLDGRQGDVHRRDHERPHERGQGGHEQGGPLDGCPGWGRVGNHVGQEDG